MKTKYDVTIQDRETNHMREAVVSAETLEEARNEARKLGRLVAVHGPHGSSIAYQGVLAAGDEL